MNENKLMKQVTAIFGLFMVFFYLGAGIFLIFFFKNTTLDRAVLVIFGSVLIFYGIFRAYRAYVSIYELFFKRDNNDD